MDEPLAALDGPRKADVLAYIQTLAGAAQIPILYVTHAMAEVTQLATQLVVLDRGKVACEGSVTEVLADPRTARYFAKRDGGALLDCTVARHDDGLTVLASPAGEVLLPGTLGQVGHATRLHIPAQDVILSRQPLAGQSALNMLGASVTAVQDQIGRASCRERCSGWDWTLAKMSMRSLRPRRWGRSRARPFPNRHPSRVYRQSVLWPPRGARAGGRRRPKRVLAM